ncbi:sodium:solute symporter family transporter [Tundrisphaera sp. TA3]|uniref:sodium:solute symporter family transporter n=1 Tax=Tundrisphaera sp. TA3 TaxID=3435775 RepID=UPI003EBFEE98
MADPRGGQADSATLVALIAFTLISLLLGFIANRAGSRSGFLASYFLGNRSMGAVAMALTAAVMSGGTFMGFPSLVYSFGWVVGLWIASYMVAPLTVMGVLGKRIGQLSRRTGAITLPDLMRERYDSPALGLLTSLLVTGFLSCSLVAQFKAGTLILQMVLPASWSAWATPEMLGGVDPRYAVGLAIFTATVVAYTAYGGFLAAIWTDIFQSLIMAVGVAILLPLALMHSGGLGAATERGMEVAGPGFAFGPGAGRDFLAPGLAFSFFVMWAISGMGQPSTLVRLMAFRDSRTLRWAILYQSAYNALIYIPLVLIFIAARGILPGLERPDEVMPRLVITLANPYVAGLILAAPYGAVMSTVSGFLLIVASGLVRDLYSRFLRPAASEREIARASYLATAGVGAAAAMMALRDVTFLQLIVVFASAGMASAFLAPALLGAFWRRATAPGALAAMAAGSAVTLVLYCLGSFPSILGIGDQGIGPKPQAFGAYYLFGCEPCVWGILTSFAVGIAVSLATAPPDPRLVSRLFDRPEVGGAKGLAPASA